MMKTKSVALLSECGEGKNQNLKKKKMNIVSTLMLCGVVWSSRTYDTNPIPWYKFTLLDIGP